MVQADGLRPGGLQSGGWGGGAQTGARGAVGVAQPHHPCLQGLGGSWRPGREDHWGVVLVGLGGGLGWGFFGQLLAWAVRRRCVRTQ